MQSDGEAQSTATQRSRNVWEAAERGVLSGSTNVRASRTAGWWPQAGQRGRRPGLRVQVASGQSTAQAAGENPGSSPKPRGGSRGTVCARYRPHHHGSRRHGWVHTGHPGTVCGQGQPPGTGARRMLPLLSSRWTGSGTRFPPQLPSRLLPGLATLSGINIEEDYSRQLQV